MIHWRSKSGVRRINFGALVKCVNDGMKSKTAKQCEVFDIVKRVLGLALVQIAPDDVNFT